MSKKKFNSGLESLFDEFASQDHEADNVSMLNKNTAPVKSRTTGGAGTKAADPSPVKSFTSDLDSLFADVVTDTIEEKVESIISKRELERKPKVRKASKPLSGLDALFRRTTEVSEEEQAVEEEMVKERKIKRVSFTFHKDRLAKLKSIAKMEKSYLKDIISEVVSGYIDEYEKKTGAIK